jgi:hypothetical protein
MTRRPKEIHEMTWGEALSRLIETKPHEVEPPPGAVAKKERPKLRKPRKAKASSGAKPSGD